MSKNSPSDIFVKAKRYSLVFSGLLLLSVYLGFEKINSTAISVFNFGVAEEALPHIIFIMTLYSVWQLCASWFVQDEVVKSFHSNRIDLFITILILFTSLFSYLGKFLIIPLFEKIEKEALSSLISFLSTFLGLFVGYYFYKALDFFKRTLFDRQNVRSKKIAKLLVNGLWILKFNPLLDNGEGEKIIGFDKTGIVDIGSNNNEHSWRIEAGLLEILNLEGRVFSRFKYYDSEDIFRHTNDEDTLSQKSQVICKALKK